MGDESEEEIPLQEDISVKINPIRRLCREDFCSPKDMESGGGGARGRDKTTRHTDEEDCVVACPVVLRQLCAQIRVQSSRGKKASINLQTIHNLLSSRPYWRRCLCSPSALPAITEKELVLLLSLTPSHRFIVLVVTNSADSLGTVVVGGESLIEAVYTAQNLPGLRPCLQSPSKPSIAFIKYQLTKPKSKKKNDRKAVPITILNNGQVKVGMVLIYQKTKMLYAGFPLASYGCSKQDFLTFISKHTQYDFCLRTPEVEQTSRSESPEPGEDILEDSSEGNT
ncbi:uncharacterized protein [Macrobrachium rosenbergii]|uniref:uncharacterized protein isoform X2 n=2 Tax=Macrobrachium rosenbergii TaxID=79674 RepID=UPI0034D67C2B